MRIVGAYSFKGGKEEIEKNYAAELVEVYDALKAVDASLYKTKTSKEKSATRQGQIYYSPSKLNKAIKAEFLQKGWKSKRVSCTYPTTFYTPDYDAPTTVSKGAYREMDFLKNKVGIEVQFGKYSFMVYNVAAKMTIFNKLGHIDVGIEIVPVKEMVKQMSSGVSYFEQFIWDLDQRGTSDIDIPVLILGIAPNLEMVEAAIPEKAQEVAEELIEDIEEIKAEFPKQSDLKQAGLDLDMP